MTFTTIASAYTEHQRREKRERRKLMERFRVHVVELLIEGEHYKRMARIARDRGDLVLFRELTIRAMVAECDRLLLLIDCPLTLEQVVEVPEWSGTAISRR